MSIGNLVEVHSHILPAIDDGAPDVRTSIKMIKKLQLQGASAIILTPHYYSDSISLDDFIARRDRALRLLQSELPEGSPRLIPAAEVYMTKYLFSNENLGRLCIGSSGYVLIEHPFSCEFGQSTYDRLLNLDYEHKIKPILAHIERYPALMEDSELLDGYIDMGCLTQVNISSFAGAGRGTRKRLLKYLETGRIHLIGSDCHNLKSRAPQYEDGIKQIIKHCGQGAIEALEKNAQMLIK